MIIARPCPTIKTHNNPIDLAKEEDTAVNNQPKYSQKHNIIQEILIKYINFVITGNRARVIPYPIHYLPYAFPLSIPCRKPSMRLWVQLSLV